MRDRQKGARRLRRQGTGLQLPPAALQVLRRNRRRAGRRRGQAPPQAPVRVSRGRRRGAVVGALRQRQRGGTLIPRAISVFDISSTNSSPVASSATNTPSGT